MRKFIRVYRDKSPLWVDVDEIVVVSAHALTLRSGETFEISASASRILSVMGVEVIKPDDNLEELK